MQVSLQVFKHPKGGYNIDLNRLVDLTKIFKFREIDNRNFCVYIFEDEFGVEQYYGMGKYYDVTKYGEIQWLQSRPFNHKDDLLINCINSNWTCRIVGLGLTNSEAHVLEAYLIMTSNRVLTIPGTKVWNRTSLINKKRERKWERLMSKYLNLDNGNNTWVVA